MSIRIAGSMNSVRNRQYRIVGSNEAHSIRLGFSPITSMPMARMEVAAYISDRYELAHNPLFIKRITVSVVKYIAGI